MTVLDDLKQKRRELLAIASRHGASNIRIFGSVVHGEEAETSDVDFLVDMEPGRSLLDLVGLQQELEQLLGRRVDVITERGINPYLEKQVIREAKPL